MTTSILRINQNLTSSDLKLSWTWSHSASNWTRRGVRTHSVGAANTSPSTAVVVGDARTVCTAVYWSIKLRSMIKTRKNRKNGSFRVMDFHNSNTHITLVNSWYNPLSCKRKEEWPLDVARGSFGSKLTPMNFECRTPINERQKRNGKHVSHERLRIWSKIDFDILD